MPDLDIHHALLLGTDMDPERIHRDSRLAGARFVAIGRVAAIDLAGVQLPLPPVDEIWGVVLRLAPGTVLDGPLLPVALRTGDAVEATVLTTPGDLDDRAAVLAEAYYWELPAAYRDALDRWAGGETSRDDAARYS